MEKNGDQEHLILAKRPRSVVDHCVSFRVLVTTFIAHEPQRTSAWEANKI